MNFLGKEIDNVRPPVTEKLLRDLEAKLGAKLPADYVSFLKSSNGCFAEYEILINNSEYISFGELFAIDPNKEWTNNPFELKRWRETPDFPQKGILPIAVDGGGSTLFLDLRNGYKVVAFVHGLPEWAGGDQTDKLLQLADSFETYWQKLTISDSFVKSCITDFEQNPDTIAKTMKWLDSGRPDWRSEYRELWNQHVPTVPI